MKGWSRCQERRLEGEIGEQYYGLMKQRESVCVWVGGIELFSLWSIGVISVGYHLAVISWEMPLGAWDFGRVNRMG